MNKVFLSYSHNDSEFVENLYQRLSRDGIKCFFDRKSVAWGENLVIALERGLEECEIIIPVLTPNYLSSEWAMVERTMGVLKDPAGLKRKLRPLLLKPCDITYSFLAAIKYIDVSTKEKYEQNYPEICQDLQGNLKEGLTEQIAHHFGLKKVLLVPTPGGAKIYEELGIKAAQYFIDNVPDNSIVGVSCGNTIFKMANSLEQFRRPLSIYPISFNVGPSLIGVMSPYATLFEICKKNPSAIAYDIPIPAFFSDLEIEKKVLLNRKDISLLLERAYNPTAAFYSVGHLGPGSSLDRASSYFREYIIPNFDHRNLENMGGCGEINWYPYSITGEPLNHPIADHCTSICLDRIKTLAKDHNRHIVLVAGGLSKINALLGALRGGYLNVLITDFDSAKKVMNIENAQK